MPISSRIRRHLQSHVVGYIALFVALSGTALALPGQKTVKGKDIANNAVKQRTIAKEAVASGKLADGAVKRKKLKGQVVTAAKLANGAVTSQQVADASLLGADFAPGEISDAFVITTPFAQGFTIKRAGRVYVIATVVTDCTTPPCNYGVLYDNGLPVPHANLTLNQPAVEKQITLVGLTDQLAAGNHLLSLLTDGDLTVGHTRLSGVLIQ